MLAREKVVDDCMVVVVVTLEKACVLFICFDMMIMIMNEVMHEVIICLSIILA